jgi:phage terminase large subunit-like protein
MNDWDQYSHDVISGKITASKWIILACQRHQKDQKDGHKRGLWFDDQDADRFIQFFEQFLHHTKGKWAGQKFLLLPWQKFTVASIFGWKHDDGSRRFSTLYCQVGRKNGKTQLLAGIGLALLDFDNEQAAEVVFAATKRDQARICHDEATRMVKSSPSLKKRITVLRNNLTVKSTNSKAEPLSSDAKSADGLSVSCAVLDEFHAHKDAALLNVLKSATGARTNPLIAIITTAGFNIGGPCFQMMRNSCDVLEGKSQDDSLFAVIYTLDEEDDFTDPSVWIKSNPSLDVTLPTTYLEKELVQSQNYGGSMLINFRTKHMNQWVSSSATWIPDEIVIRKQKEIEPDPMQKCWGGLDLASVSDVTALTLVWPHEGGYITRSWFWIPEDAVEKRLQTSGSRMYEDFGSLDNVFVTEGNVTDYDCIRRFVTGYHIQDGSVKHDPDPLASRFNIESIAFDRFNSSQCVINLASDGIKMEPYGQGFVSMSTPSKELERLMSEGKIQHGCDPVIRWMFGNVVLKTDPSGNIKPDKDKSGDKIDGIISLIMSIGQTMTDQTKTPNTIPDTYTIRIL